MNYKETLTELGWKFLRKCQTCGGSKEYWIKDGNQLVVRPYRKVWILGSKKGTFDEFSQLA